MNILIGVIILVGALAGCATRAPDMVEQGVISLEVIQPKEVKISQVKIDKQSSGIQIAGRITRQGYILPMSFVGHIDVTVIGPDGNALVKKGTSYFPRRVPRKGRSHFKVFIPINLMPSSIVKIELHEMLEIKPEEHSIRSGSHEPRA